MEAVEEQQRQVDVGEKEPRQRGVVVDHRCDGDGLDERRAADPDSDVGHYEERDDATAWHLLQVTLRQRIATQAAYC